MAGGNWLLAWALADPSYAERLFDAELAALESQPDVNLHTIGLLKIAEVLVQPPNRREAFLRQHLGATWYPGSERNRPRSVTKFHFFARYGTVTLLLSLLVHVVILGRPRRRSSCSTSRKWRAGP